MKLKHLITVSALALLTVTAVPTAMAQTEQEKGWFVGGSLGQSDDDILDEEDTGLKIFGGYQFMKYFALELAFVDLGEFEFFGFPDALEQYGFAVQGVGILPIAESFALFAKAGFFNWEVEAFGATDDGTDAAYGVGGQFRFGAKKKLGLRLEWERFTDISGGDVDLVSAGFSYHFR